MISLAFYKFIKKEHAGSFCSGSMFFKNLEYYRTLEEKERTGRADANDGLLVSNSCYTPYGTLIEFKLKTNRKCDLIMCVSRNIRKNNIEKMRAFGDTVVIIEDEDAFIEKIKNAAKQAGYQTVFKDVYYYKDGLEQENMERITNGLVNFSFFKQENLFGYQQEFRFLIHRNDTEEENLKKLDIGDISTITEIVPVETLFDRLL